MRTLLALVSLAPLLAAQDRGTLPNVVLVLADDLGFGDPGCYNDESRIPTPNVDRLASEGMRFTDAHSPSSVCSPTRYGILTGRYAWRTPLEKGVLWPWDPPLIEDERLTLPEMLREVGYRTACIGKWHLGWNWPLDDELHVTDLLDDVHWPSKRRAEIGARVDWQRPVRGGPLAHGFDSYFGDDVPNFPPYAWIEDDRVTAVPTVAKPRGMFGHAGPATPGWDLSTVLPTLAQRAAAWIDERGRDDATRPFFLYVTLTSPHTPIAPSPRWRGASAAGAYGDFVAETDWVLGEVLAALERNGFANDTLMVFTSDNGSPQRDGREMGGRVGSVKTRYGHDPSRPWRGLKADIWEGGHRVPFIVRWPGVVPPSSTSDATAVHTDLFRTIAEVVGYPLPADAAEDSFSLGPVLRGDGPPIRDHLVHHSSQGMFAIRIGQWKLILGKGSGGFSPGGDEEGAPEGQLYDLPADPGETRNLYAEHADVVRELSARLQSLRDAGRSFEPGGR